LSCATCGPENVSFCTSKQTFSCLRARHTRLPTQKLQGSANAEQSYTPLTPLQSGSRSPSRPSFRRPKRTWEAQPPQRRWHTPHSQLRPFSPPLQLAETYTEAICRSCLGQSALGPPASSLGRSALGPPAQGRMFSSIAHSPHRLTMCTATAPPANCTCTGPPAPPATFSMCIYCRAVCCAAPITVRTNKLRAR
jgi:hypothetical protein